MSMIKMTVECTVEFQTEDDEAETSHEGDVLFGLIGEGEWRGQTYYVKDGEWRDGWRVTSAVVLPDVQRV